MNEFFWMGAVFAALLGLAFGSFLNVCLTRLPAEESILAPRSHCRACDYTLAWWDNLPLLSWILLRGRCRNCRAWIGIRYPLVEAVVGALWAGCWVAFSPPLFAPQPGTIGTPHIVAGSVIRIFGSALLCWMLVALAALDVEYLWLPDVLTLPGIALGFVYTLARGWAESSLARPVNLLEIAGHAFLAILAGAGIVLFIRLAYWIVRRQEGMGLGDAKLLAMLGAWLGLTGALESFALSVFSAAAAALVWLLILFLGRQAADWAKMPMPLGTFFCIAAVVEVFYPNWSVR